MTEKIINYLYEQARYVYDDAGREIRYERIRDGEVFIWISKEYTKEGKLKRYDSWDGGFLNWEYDENGNQISEKSEDGYGWKAKYLNNRKSEILYSDGRKREYVYDDNGKLVKILNFGNVIS
jgi:hypothetical protein